MHSGVPTCWISLIYLIKKGDSWTGTCCGPLYQLSNVSSPIWYWLTYLTAWHLCSWRICKCGELDLGWSDGRKALSKTNAFPWQDQPRSKSVMIRSPILCMTNQTLSSMGLTHPQVWRGLYMYFTGIRILHFNLSWKSFDKTAIIRKICLGI